MTDFAAIADRAFEILGDNDPGQFQTAFDVMVAETHTVTLSENWESELAIMSRLGPAYADTILSKIEGAVSPRVVRMIQSERGVNLADPQTVGLVNMLVGGSVLTQAEADDLLATNTEVQLKWQGLTTGQVSDAIRMRQQGDI